MSNGRRFRQNANRDSMGGYPCCCDKDACDSGFSTTLVSGTQYRFEMDDATGDSSNPVASKTWFFSDDETTSTSNPAVHTFDSGLHFVSLLVILQDGTHCQGHQAIDCRDSITCDTCQADSTSQPDYVTATVSGIGESLTASHSWANFSGVMPDSGTSPLRVTDSCADPVGPSSCEGGQIVGRVSWGFLNGEYELPAVGCGVYSIYLPLPAYVIARKNDPWSDPCETSPIYYPYDPTISPPDYLEITFIARHFTSTLARLQMKYISPDSRSAVNPYRTSADRDNSIATWNSDEALPNPCWWSELPGSMENSHEDITFAEATNGVDFNTWTFCEYSGTADPSLSSCDGAGANAGRPAGTETPTSCPSASVVY